MNTTYAQRLGTAMQRANVTKTALATHLKISVQAIRKFFPKSDDAAVSNMLAADNSAKAARFLEVSHYWLATGEGAMLPANRLSPLALDLAKAFDAVPLDARDKLHANLMYSIDLATGIRQPTERSVVPATAQPAPDK